MSDKDQWWPKRENWPEFLPHVWPEESIAKLPHLKHMHGYRYGAEQALALLILDEVVFPLNGGETYGISVQVLCNDVFYWACADAEPIPCIGGSVESDAPFW